MLKQFLFLIITTLVFTACTPQETEDSNSVDFTNKTEYRNYDNSNYWFVNVHAVYTAKIYKNDILIGDTTYVNNMLFYKKTDNSYWKTVENFGKDSLAVILRTNDSAYVRCKDSLIYRVKFDSLITKLIGKSHSQIKDSTYSSIDSANIIKIDSINTALNKYLTYPKWKDAIMRKYF